MFVNALQSSLLFRRLPMPKLENRNPAGKNDTQHIHSQVKTTNISGVLQRKSCWKYPHNTFLKLWKKLHTVSCLSADVIMDMLGDPKMRLVISSYYEDCGEEESVKRAVTTALSSNRDQLGIEEVDSATPPQVDKSTG